jgi:hypothetical protein
MSFQQTRMAADRILMVVISTSPISLGFAIFQFFSQASIENRLR